MNAATKYSIRHDSDVVHWLTSETRDERFNDQYFR